MPEPLWGIAQVTNSPKPPKNIHSRLRLKILKRFFLKKQGTWRKRCIKAIRKWPHYTPKESAFMVLRPLLLVALLLLSIETGHSLVGNHRDRLRCKDITPNRSEEKTRFLNFLGLKVISRSERHCEHLLPGTPHSNVYVGWATELSPVVSLSLWASGSSTSGLAWRHG